MRTTNKRQILLAHVMHPLPPPCLDWMNLATTVSLVYPELRGAISPLFSSASYSSRAQGIQLNSDREAYSTLIPVCRDELQPIPFLRVMLPLASNTFFLDFRRPRGIEYGL
jgi:hypothetical protein